MKYQVRLRLFEDDATGEWGLAHDNAIDTDRPFNAFWTPQGIFHDVFEHYFEEQNRWFLGDAAFNIGGEIAAMGHLAYYYDQFCLDKRTFSGAWYNFEDTIVRSTHDEIQESVSYGYCNYGSELICTLPYQRPTYDRIEDIIEQHWDRCKELPIKADDYDEREYGIRYRRSLSKSKFQRLYRWGWNQAEKIAPYTYENRQTLEEFLEFWEKFTKNNDAKELAQAFRFVTFTIRGGNNLKWDAIWTTQDNQKVRNSQYIMDDILELEY